MEVKNKETLYVSKEELHTILNKLTCQISKLELQLMLIKRQIEK